MGIDECQFFKDLDTVVLDLVQKNIIVVCAGLTGDYKRDLFGKTHILIPHADDLIFSVAYCSICKNGNKAQFTKRIKNYEGVIDIGACADVLQERRLSSDVAVCSSYRQIVRC